MMCKAYPKSVEMKTGNERIPLHYACMSGFYLRDSSLEVLNLLISAYPQGIDAKDIDENVPSYYLKEAVSECNGTEHLYLLHKAVKAGLSIHLVNLLLQGFPESCITKDNDGMVPLHHACASQALEQIDLKLL
jgi:hypothetical protein